MSQPPILDGLKVVELATFVLAPAAGTVLADFGAEVLHVENPKTGDPYRHLHLMKPLPECELPYCWTLTNRNKRSLALDLKQEEGKKILHQLVEGTDVFITNFHPSVLAALSARYEDLAPLNSRLVYAHATGYGECGNEVEKPGYDATAWWARSGLMDAVRAQGADHALATAGMGDNPSAMSLFAAIMLALYRREQSGQGGLVKTSLIANGAWSNSIMLQAAMCGATPFEAPTRTTTPNALVNPYTCSDGESFYLAMIGEVGEWGPLTEAIGRPELCSDPRFVDVESRRKNSVALVQLLDDVFATQPLAHWRDVLDEHKITFGIINRSEDVPQDQQLIDNGIFREIEGSDGLRTVDSPIAVAGVPKRPPGPAPALGQHSADVLEELGYSRAAIAELSAAGVINQGG